MAGDWIKVEKATARKPEVLRIADQLSIHPDHAFGLCVRFWFWCDDQMADGHAPSVTNVTLNSVFGHAGFVESLIDVGWLRVRGSSLEVPNFDRHLSESAKNRALSSRRQQNRRSEPVTEMSRSKRDKSVTREEKSIKPPTPLPERQQSSGRLKWGIGEQEIKTDIAALAWLSEHGSCHGLANDHRTRCNVLAARLQASGSDSVMNPVAAFIGLLKAGAVGEWKLGDEHRDEAKRRLRELERERRGGSGNGFIDAGNSCAGEQVG